MEKWFLMKDIKQSLYFLCMQVTTVWIIGQFGIKTSDEIK